MLSNVTGLRVGVAAVCGVDVEVVVVVEEVEMVGVEVVGVAV